MNFIQKVLAYEPVMTVAFATSAIAAVANTLSAFGVYRLTDEERAAILSVVMTFGPVAGFVVRQQVVPVVKV